MEVPEAPGQASGFRHFGKRDSQRVRHPFTVGRIGLQAVADVAYLDLLGRVAHGAGGVGDKHRPLEPVVS